MIDFFIKVKQQAKPSFLQKPDKINVLFSESVFAKGVYFY
jgi:hypothetical protein